MILSRCRSHTLRLLPTILAIVLSGCVSWRASTPNATTFEQLRERPQAIRAHLINGTVVSFRVPAVRGDSILEVDQLHGSGRTIAISNISRVETRTVELGPTILAAAGGFVGFVLLAVFLSGPWYGP